MGMAQAAKELFEKNLKYSNGEPVKVVIADTTIGRVAEAAACEEQFEFVVKMAVIIQEMMNDLSTVMLWSRLKSVPENILIRFI